MRRITALMTGVALLAGIWTAPVAASSPDVAAPPGMAIQETGSGYWWALHLTGSDGRISTYEGSRTLLGDIFRLYARVTVDRSAIPWVWTFDTWAPWNPEDTAITFYTGTGTGFRNILLDHPTYYGGDSMTITVTHDACSLLGLYYRPHWNCGD